MDRWDHYRFLQTDDSWMDDWLASDRRFMVEYFLRQKLLIDLAEHRESTRHEVDIGSIV